MPSNLFTEISLIIAVAALVASIMKVLRQPLIIGHLITGAIVGPAFLNIIHHDTAFTGLSSLGVALLLFTVGLDLSLKTLARLSKTVLITTGLQIVAVASVSYLVSTSIGFGRLESAILGLALAMSSTIIIVKLFGDKKESTRLYAQITIGVLLLQDIIATIAKIILAAKSSNDSSQLELLLLVGRGIVLTSILYFSARYLVPLLSRAIESSKELLLLFALGWGLGFAALFQYIGFSIEVGALFAGISLSGLSFSSEMSARLKPLRDVFIVIFLITLGQAMTPDRIIEILPFAAIFSLIVVIVKPLSVLSAMGILGYTKRASFKASISMSQISEFSLVFVAAGLASGYISEILATTVTLVALITFTVSAYLIKYDNKLYAILEKHLRLFERKKTNLEQEAAMHAHTIVLFGYRKGGQEFIKTFRSMASRFVVVDYDPDVIEILERKKAPFLYGDATDPELLEEMLLERSKLIVSTMSDHSTNMMLANWLKSHNPKAVFVCSADTAALASELYASGAAYVMMPHYIGSEKISTFIKKNGFNKTLFKQYREKHLSYLQTHFDHQES